MRKKPIEEKATDQIRITSANHLWLKVETAKLGKGASIDKLISLMRKSYKRST